MNDKTTKLQSIILAIVGIGTLCFAWYTFTTLPQELQTKGRVFDLVGVYSFIGLIVSCGGRCLLSVWGQLTPLRTFAEERGYKQDTVQR